MQKNGYHDFPLKIFCLTAPKNFVEETFNISEKFGYRKISCIKGGRGYHDFPSEFFCPRVAKNYVVETFCASENFWYRKVLWIRGGREGVSRFSVENVWSHGAEKVYWVTSECFRKFLGSKSLMDKRGREGGRYHDFLSESFCFTVPKKILGEPFGVSENFRHRNILCLRGGYHDGLSETVCLTVPKNFVGEPFSSSEKFCYRNFSYIRGGQYHDFPSW